ncbi:MAG: DegT/DnrJ/EryC1/StrS family aminotransferase [candidate division Zixibacteria bacterium]|nr:DegT/DnrJ/EryC1/StrS family aminotransferase [candidate division Zixibacteria bacterium]
MKWKVTLSDLNFDQRERKMVDRVIRSKWLTMGETVQKLEKNFADFVGAKHAIAVSSGTAALHLAMRALEIKPDDEVIVPSLSFVASSNAILYVGAKPVFVDISSLNDFNLSCDDLKKKITSKTKAIVVVHYGGYLADMEKIKKIARKHKLFIIEDSAHAIGADLSSKMAGTLGDVGCFSFFSNKNLATGEGGMVVTDDDRLARKIKLLRSHGMTSMTMNRHKGHAYSYDVVELGYNYRMTEISAALGILQLEKLIKGNKKRKALTDLYVANLKEADSLSIPFQDYPRKSSYHLFPVLLNRKVNRKKFMELLKKEGIQSSIHYPSIHKFSYYRKNLKGSQTKLPLTEYVGTHEVTLPLHPLLKKEDVIFVCEKIKKILPNTLR